MRIDRARTLAGTSPTVNEETASKYGTGGSQIRKPGRRCRLHYHYQQPDAKWQLTCLGWITGDCWNLLHLLGVEGEYSSEVLQWAMRPLNLACSLSSWRVYGASVLPGA